MTAFLPILCDNSTYYYLGIFSFAPITLEFGVELGTGSWKGTLKGSPPPVSGSRAVALSFRFHSQVRPQRKDRSPAEVRLLPRARGTPQLGACQFAALQLVRDPSCGSANSGPKMAGDSLNGPLLNRYISDGPDILGGSRFRVYEEDPDGVPPASSRFLR